LPIFRAFLWLAGVGPFMMFSLIQNRNLRYPLPILPAAAPLAASMPAACRRRDGEPEKLMAAEFAGAVGFRTRVGYKPEALLRGEAERVEIRADSALVGEMARRDHAPLRIRNIRVDIEGLPLDRRRFMERGRSPASGCRCR